MDQRLYFQNNLSNVVTAYKTLLIASGTVASADSSHTEKNQPRKLLEVETIAAIINKCAEKWVENFYNQSNYPINKVVSFILLKL